MDKPHSHRPSQKQANKPFKSKHASKSSVRDAAKGRVGKPAVKQQTKKPSNASVEAAFKKANRKHHAKQMQDKKQAALAEVGALFSRKGASGERVQRIIAVVPLTNDVSALELVEQLLGAVGVECQGEGGYRTGE